MPAHDCWYPPAVDVQDVLRVDFDRRSIGPDGLYLVEEVGEDGRVVWRGCRRFAHRLAGGLELDTTGEGNWMPIDSLARINWRIAGHVEQVYKPAR